MADFQKHNVVLLAAICLILGSLACEKDPVTPPERVQEGYYIFATSWFRRTDNPQLYRYDTYNKQLDSFSLPSSTTQEGVAADEHLNRVYLANGVGILVLDAESGQIITQRRINAIGCQLSPDGKWLAIPGSRLTILDSRTLREVYVIDTFAFSGKFSDDSRTFFCPTFLDDTSIAKGYPILSVNLCDGSTVLKFNDYGTVGVDRDERLGLWSLYVRVCCSFVWALVLIDDNGQERFNAQVIPGNGRVCSVCSRGRVFYSNPGSIFFGPDPSSALHWVDTRTMATDSLPLVGLQVPDYYPEFRPQYIVSSNDDSIMAVSDFLSPRLLVLRLSDMAITDTLSFGNIIELGKPAVIGKFKR